MSETQISLDTSLAFDLAKQSAILGWCLRDKLFCKQCSFAVKQEWFSSPTAGKVYSAVMTLYRQFHKVPTPEDVYTYRPFTQEDARSQQRLKDTVVEALAKTQRYSLEILRAEMTEWMHAVIFSQSLQQAVTTYNAKKVKEAWSVVEAATLFKASATFEDGFNMGFQPAAKRILSEREERMAQAKRILSYGNGYLNDAIGGITPNDLIVLGAATGAGKTQMATSISLENATVGGADGKGVPVHYFALEAEEDEIERRIKYGLISGAYYTENNGPDRAYISYKAWRMGYIDHILAPYEEKMQGQLEESVKNLNTLYRTSGSFDLKALERNLLDVIMDSRLIVIDHLHYIDTDGDDENKAYKHTVKLIRDIVLHYSVPVVLIAHLRKKQGGFKNQPLMPSIDDFHGTSDVPKIATTCIMMAPASGHAAAHPWQKPTYIGVVKNRLDGGLTRYCALVNFNERTRRYEKAYRLSSMYDVMGGEFSDLMGNQIPPWASPIEQKLTDSSLG
jgi:hypothetical protein